MNKTQELKERIYKHCPELKELSFGCEVKMVVYSKKHRKEINGKVLYYSIPIDGGRLKTWIVKPDNMNTLKDFGEVSGGFTNSTEILGHPIHLEHVLRAIQESYFNCVYYPAITGSEMKLNICANGKEVNYSLTKTFYQNCENPELVDFLLEVIK